MNRIPFLFLFFCFLFGCAKGQLLSEDQSVPEGFSNPLLPSGADPFSFYHEGYYYYTHTLQDRIEIWKTKDLSQLDKAEKKVIWTPPSGTAYSKEIWAPEIHFINGSWYVYFAADDGDNNNHRMFVLQNDSQDPMQGDWEFRGQLTTTPDRWAIDGNVFTYNNKLYIVWSGWAGHTNGQQNIYIAQMKDPLTINSKRVLLSEPTHNWERQGDLDDQWNPPHVAVNEGPQFLEHEGKIFLVYSANGCWTDNYNLGLLSFDGTDIMSPQAWSKHSRPIFSKSVENGVFAPGHNSFFTSPNGKETWMLYHANNQPNDGCGVHRSPRMQKISWNEDDTPNLGIPVKSNQILSKPSK